MSYADYIPVKVKESNSDIRLAVHLTVAEAKRLWLTDDKNAAITWKSLSTSFVDVDSDGVITGLAQGLSSVEATVFGNTHPVYVRVK